MFRKTITHIAIVATLALAILAATSTSALAGGRCRTCGALPTTKTTVLSGHSVDALTPNSSRWP